MGAPLEMIDHLRAMNMCHAIHDEKPDVVTGLLVFLTGVTKANDEFDLWHVLLVILRDRIPKTKSQKRKQPMATWAMGC